MHNCTFKYRGKRNERRDKKRHSDQKHTKKERNKNEKESAAVRRRDMANHGSFQMAFVKCGEVSNYPLKNV